MNSPFREFAMAYYFAPLEGITDSIYRKVHHSCFPGLDRYYTPFFSPTIHRALTNREARELPPAQDNGFYLVPQVLTKVPEDFLWMAGVCRDLGYTEVNLNLGCPSGTVTAKGKGAGMLRDWEGLARFLDEVMAKSVLPVSLKTRLGYENREEFYPLLDLFNRYPVKELTVHPRVRQAFYSGPVDREMFQYALENTHIPLCWSGDITSKAELKALQGEFPRLSAVMLGRGLVGDPGMLCPGGTTAEALEQFYNLLLEGYLEAFGGSRNAMFRLKENWHYTLALFEADPKLVKRLRKTTDLAEYQSITQELFHNTPMRTPLLKSW